MTSSIFKIIFTTWVANCNWPFFDNRVSNIFWSFMFVSSFDIQSIPKNGFFVSACLAFDCERAFNGFKPEFSARDMGICSRASANALTAYCSVESMVLAWLWIAKLQAISEAPPPQTILLHLIRVVTTHKASWRDLVASSTIILDPPRIKTVTALQFEHSSTTSIFSSPVPKWSSLILPAFPNFSAVTSSNLGMILAPVAIATSSMSTPPTHLTAGSLFWRSKWLA